MKALKIAATVALTGMIGISAALAAGRDNSDRYMYGQSYTYQSTTNQGHGSNWNRLHPYDGSAAPLSGD
ncbi:MAG TPA: hypothetical protein VL574_07645 [Stellaceae bacterium]|jgi:hypothetical protein|nr:hypothetical protein [Stellaceae bacterium]